MMALPQEARSAQSSMAAKAFWSRMSPGERKDKMDRLRQLALTSPGARLKKSNSLKSAWAKRKQIKSRGDL
jgi:hypothetical protein